MEETGPRARLMALSRMVVIIVLGLSVTACDNYTALSTENPIASHQDGIQILAAPADLDGSFKVKLDSVPQLTFLEGSAGDELRRAAESLPPNLFVKSPYYEISAKGEAPDSTTIALNIPNNAEPWETLDLYTWTEEGWQWVGGWVDTERELILAKIGKEIPESAVVMQVGAVVPGIATDLSQGQSVAGAANSGITHLLPTGLMLGDAGTILGNPTLLPLPSATDSFALLPSLRNWTAETGVDTSPTSNVNQGLLANPGAHKAHIDNIVALVVGQGYAGIDLDYRGVGVNWRDTYSQFVNDLATALHEQGRVLSVAVEAPSPLGSGNWDTGGYDWRALGQTADILRVPFPVDPAFYDGGYQSYLAWALSQVSRQKLFPILSTDSTDQVAGKVTRISQAKALAPLGTVVGPDGVVVSPGEAVQVDLGGEALDSLQRDEHNQTYSYTFHDDQGVEHRVTVMTGASLARMLGTFVGHHLGGVFIQGLLAPGSDPALTDMARQFASQTPPTFSDDLQVVWTVQGTEGEQLAREIRPLVGDLSFEWTVPDGAGEYRISAAVGFQSTGEEGVQGSISVSVGASEPVSTTAAVLTPTATPTPTSESKPPAVAANLPDCLNSTYVADVTIPDNTRLEKAESFVKTWRVRNTGSCAWPDDTTLTFIQGDQLNAPKSVSVGGVEPGSTIDISVEMAAPGTDGTFKGTWRLTYGGGNPFGTNLTVVIKAGDEPPPSPTQPAPAPPPSGGGGFELGGQTHTLGHPNEMHYAGMTWVKFQHKWSSGQNPNEVAGRIQAAHGNGFKVLLSIPGGSEYPSSIDFGGYVEFLRGVAALGPDAIEVWNEQNIDREWPAGTIDPASYVRNILAPAYNAIKSVNPNIMVISGAPAPTGYFGGCSGAGCDDAPYIAGMLAAGAANYVDCVGIHYNEGILPPSQTSGDPRGSSSHYTRYFWGMVNTYWANFGGARKLCFTELGYVSPEGYGPLPPNFAWAANTSVGEQAAWLAEAAVLASGSGKVRLMIVYNVDFTLYSASDPQAGYAIIRPDGSCPACESLRAALQ